MLTVLVRAGDVQTCSTVGAFRYLDYPMFAVFLVIETVQIHVENIASLGHL